MLEVVFDPCLGITSFNIPSTADLQKCIRNHIQLNLNSNVEFYTLHNGRKITETPINGVIHVIPCLPGGKGGFGSMLRAIGAQIEKTTNREACRDLSGRRLRDINEEKRLKKWIAEQAEREREAEERRKRKRSKMIVEPKHEFSDPDYDKARSEMVDKVHDAVEEGLKNLPSQGTSSEGSEEKAKKKKKEIKGALWVDELDGLDELDDSDADDDDDEEEETPKKKVKVCS